MVISPESELGKEMAKWNKPYHYEPFPKMLYRANRRPDGKPSVGEALDSFFGGQPGAAELFSNTCQMIVQDERERTKYLEMGWRETQAEAMDLFEMQQVRVSDSAAHRAHEDRNMGEKAQVEAKAAEEATMEHVAEVPRQPIRRAVPFKAPVPVAKKAKRGRPRKGA